MSTEHKKHKLLRAYYACMSHRDLISSMLANIGRMIVDDFGIQGDKIYESGVALFMEEAQFALAIKDFLSILDASSPLKNLAPGAKFRYIDPPDTHRGVWIKTSDFDGDHLYRVVRISDGDLRRESGSTTVERADLDISDSRFVLPPRGSQIG